MNISNLYATLAEYKAFATSRGQTATTDATDDAVISAMLQQISRYIDQYVAFRKFYPSFKTRLYDIPRGDRQLFLDDDLLEVVTFTNGDGSVISSESYVLMGDNDTPAFGIELLGASAPWAYWLPNVNGSIRKVISINGLWGYHEDYANAWVPVGTLGAAITDTTTFAFTMTAGHSVSVGQILKIGSEIYNVATVATNTITPNQRGDNGSTAITHLSGATVYAWAVMDDIKLAVLEIALGVSALRTGQSSSGKVSITANGVVIRPEEIPPMAQRTIDGYRRTGWL